LLPGLLSSSRAVPSFYLDASAAIRVPRGMPWRDDSDGAKCFLFAPVNSLPKRGHFYIKLENL
jgi:hypothetical protein